ncbi:MAG: hypothetical protein ACO2O2_14040 [Acidilobaceae archaeon]
MLRAFAVSLLLLLSMASAASAPIASSSQLNVADVLENRHTPGFPGILNITSIDDLLSVSSPDVRKALEKLLQCDTLECIEGDEFSANILKSILFNSTGVDIIGLRALSDSQLLDMIDDTSIRGLLESLNRSGNLGPLEIDRLVNELESARSRGSISPQAYMAALELLRRMLERSGNPQGEVIERRQVEAIREALVEASRRGLLSELLERISGLYRESQGWSSSFNSQRGGSKVESPRVRFELPSVSPSILMLILLASLAIITLFSSQRLGALIASIVRRREGEEVEFRDIPLIPGLYWSGVRLIERVSGARMDASTTHREFLARIEGKVGELERPFKGLTLSYELYRYAGLSGRGVEEQALRYYEDLERASRVRSS